MGPTSPAPDLLSFSLSVALHLGSVVVLACLALHLPLSSLSPWHQLPPPGSFPARVSAHTVFDNEL